MLAFIHSFNYLSSASSVPITSQCMGSYQCRHDQVPVLTEAIFWAFFSPFLCICPVFFLECSSPTPHLSSKLLLYFRTQPIHEKSWKVTWKLSLTSSHWIVLLQEMNSRRTWAFLVSAARSVPRTVPDIYWVFNKYLSSTSYLPKYLSSYVFLP